MNPLRTAYPRLPLAVLALAALAATGAGAQTTVPPAPAAPVAAAPSGASLAVQMGCLNCHGAARRGEAPSFARMQERASKGTRSRDELVKHWLEEMREKGGGGWSAVVVHRQVADSTARALAEWLATPASKPVN